VDEYGDRRWLVRQAHRVRFGRSAQSKKTATNDDIYSIYHLTIDPAQFVAFKASPTRRSTNIFRCRSGDWRERVERLEDVFAGDENHYTIMLRQMSRTPACGSEQAG
jgi:hypothetical protein